MAYVGRVYDCGDEVIVRTGMFHTFIKLDTREGKIEISLDDHKVKELIALLEKAIK